MMSTDFATPSVSSPQRQDPALSALPLFSLSFNQINFLAFSPAVSLSHSLYSTPSEILISLSWLPRGLPAAAAAGHHCRQAAASCEEGTYITTADTVCVSARAFVFFRLFWTRRNHANARELLIPARYLPQTQNALFQSQTRAGLNWQQHILFQ